MKLGCCANIEQAESLRKAGYDFIECAVVSLIPEQSDEEFSHVLKHFQASKLPVGACNIFLPGDMKVVGENVDNIRIKNYVEKSLLRVKQIGADIVVFGSGGSRPYPDGFSREKAVEQIVCFLHVAADYAEKLGITIVIEPLNTKESNMINSIPEAVEIAEKVNRKHVQVLADFYHMYEENEPLENIVLYKNYLSHIHVADIGRFAPGTGSYPYKKFVERIKKSGYDGNISIECNWNDFESEITPARNFLEKIFEI